MTRYLNTFFVMLALGCTPKASAPKDWSDWTQELNKRYQEKFASPTITHHIYLEKAGEKAWLDVSGSYPRFLKEACDKCTLQVRRSEGLKVEMNVKGMQDWSEVSTEEPSPIFNNDKIFLSAYPSEEDDQVRVFAHDLSQKKLPKKRQRDFFDYDGDLKIKTQWKWLDQPQTVTIQRSDGSQKDMEKVAEVTGEKGGKSIILSVFNFAGNDQYKNNDRTMLLFRDYSNGKTTYGAGRFLVVQFPKKIGEMKNQDEVTVDFNYSYNPPCAVSTGFHCPLPIDTAALPIEVGEKYTKL